MLLRILKSNQVYNLILIPAIGILLWSVSLISPESYPFYQGEGNNVLFKLVYSIIKNTPFIQIILTIGLLIISGILINRLNLKFAVIRKRTLLPSSYFIILASGIKDLHHLHPVFFSSIFILLALNRMFQAYDQKNINSISIDTGFLVGIASLFYFNSLILFPAFLLGLINIKREISYRCLFLNFIGVLLPWIFSFFWYFFFDKTDELIIILSQNLFTETGNAILDQKISVILLLGFQLFLIFISSLNLIKFFDTKKVSSRRYFVSFLWIFIFLLAGIFLLPSASTEILILLFIPVSFLISNFLVYLKNKLWGEIIFAVFIGISIYMQFT